MDEWDAVKRICRRSPKLQSVDFVVSPYTAPAEYPLFLRHIIEYAPLLRTIRLHARLPIKLSMDVLEMLRPLVHLRELRLCNITSTTFDGRFAQSTLPGVAIVKC